MKTSLPACAFALICLSDPFSMTAANRYVNVNSTNPIPPYANWATAATVIQDAVDVAEPGDDIVVTNGVYEMGGRLDSSGHSNRVFVTMPLTVRSVNGPRVTVIDGSHSLRCAYLGHGVTLEGFTLTNGVAQNNGACPETWCTGEEGGGGVICSNAIVSNCVLSGNYGYFGGGALGGSLNGCTLTANSAGLGGGAYLSTLNNCILSGNFAGERGGGANWAILNSCLVIGNSTRELGGGAAESTLNNCSLRGNSAREGGGALNSTLNNCVLTANSADTGGGAQSGALNNSIVYSNVAANGANYLGTTLNYSCTTPMPTNGIGNITNAPLFVDAAAGNFRLQSNSPCINAGRNAYAPSSPDLDGNPRIAGGTVDMGAYEFQSPHSTISYAWLQQFGLPMDGSVDFVDSDGDGHNNWQEWRAWTDPTNSASALRLLTPLGSTSGLLVRWQSVSGQSYFLERSTNLAAHPPFVPFASNIVGQADTTVFTDTNLVGPGPLFYRVGVNEYPE